jgi:hypothetical protein
MFRKFYHKNIPFRLYTGEIFVFLYDLDGKANFFLIFMEVLQIRFKSKILVLTLKQF